MSFEELPIYRVESPLRQSLRERGCAVLCAPTGSGKSTQVPKWLLDELPEPLRVIVLQPRRLAARVLAQRVAWELGEKLPGRVGYITRFEKQVSASTRILFVTEGILTRMLLHTNELANCGAVIFDEFHERSLNADLGLAMVQHLRKGLFPALKVVVMSATIDADRISGFLDDAPVVRSDGRLFPIDISYTPRSDLTNLYTAATKALREMLHDHPEGDVLVFMPGAGEIRRCIDEFSKIDFGEEVTLCSLYGEMPVEEQHLALEKAAGRKVIVATNIAETSLTIPGVRMVIDSGLVKTGRYDSARGVDILELTPIAADSANQRSGRAGREAPGWCRRLWSAVEQDHKPPHSLPEIQRMDLADTVLTVHSYGFADCHGFGWFERPSEKALAVADKLLQSLGLVVNGAVTPLGHAIQRYAAHPRIALMLHLAQENGCFEEACVAAAMMTSRPLLSRNTVLAIPREGVLPSDLSVMASLLKQARQSHFSIDACERIGIQATAAREISRDAENLLRMRGHDGGTGTHDRLSLNRIIMRCFPDRIARMTNTADGSCELPLRHRGQISPQSSARRCPFFVATEIREVANRTSPGGMTELSCAVGIQEEWLWEDFADNMDERDELFWDSAKQQVLRRRTLRCNDLVLEESIRNDASSEAAADLLAEQLDSNSTPLVGWDDACLAFIERVRFLNRFCPELQLPLFDDEDCRKIRRRVCEGEYRYSAVKNKPVLPYLHHYLTPEQLSAVQRLCPETLPLPKNRKLRIVYRDGLPPKGSARIQELYDVKGPLTVVNGRVPVLLDILAPNFRTVQITDDLPRFWQVHYPAMKTQLSRRYPRHEWR